MDESAYLLHRGDALDAYRHWPAPVAIISDGAYGVRGFHGDTVGTGGLATWYRPHVQAWSQYSTAATTLWFWNTEVGWATVHPLITAAGWEYVQVITWDKGVAHIAGNVNGKTIRRFPVVTEVCAFYQRRFEVCGADGPMPVQQWIRHEWRRAGLPLAKANDSHRAEPARGLRGLVRLDARRLINLRVRPHPRQWRASRRDQMKPPHRPPHTSATP
jgi:site-specific DNA-methyltransferase (adenine-specific)